MFPCRVLWWTVMLYWDDIVIVWVCEHGNAHMLDFGVGQAREIFRGGST